MTSFVYLIEMIGTIAFAISGAIVAVEKCMDIFGVIVLGVTTAVGGGMIRDVLLGNLPPTMFKNPTYVIVAVITSILVFILMYYLHEKIDRYSKFMDQCLNLADSIGLGIFVVAGVNTAAVHGFSDLAFLSIFVGTLTGVGGGVTRDILAGRVPVIFQKRVYAVAAILGASAYYYISTLLDTNTAMLIGISVTLTIRMLATYFEWNLPRIHERKKN
ncbi:MAG: trimeric intracellular cation channel family protein [Clostridiales bacterium]|nr:trimeric intracellular cation channel family protein [Clostridiales bacterium]